MKIKDKLHALEKVNKINSNHKVFSMYLNTDPSDPEQQGGKWKIHLKNGLRNFESYLATTSNEQELQSFQRVKEKVNRFVHDHEQMLQRGIILFATADEAVWFANLVQMRVKTDMYWQSTPVLDQIKQLESKFPYTGIVLVQKNEVKVVEAHLNEVEDTAYYELDLETDDWREKVGPQPAHVPKGMATANNQLDQFEERYKANQHRWFKRIAKKIDKQAKQRKWQKICVIGESDYANKVKEQMDMNVHQLIQKNMLDDKTDKILNEVAG